MSVGILRRRSMQSCLQSVPQTTRATAVNSSLGENGQRAFPSDAVVVWRGVAFASSRIVLIVLWVLSVTLPGAACRHAQHDHASDCRIPQWDYPVRSLSEIIAKGTTQLWKFFCPKGGQHASNDRQRSSCPSVKVTTKGTENAQYIVWNLVFLQVKAEDSPFSVSYSQHYQRSSHASSESATSVSAFFVWISLARQFLFLFCFWSVFMFVYLFVLKRGVIRKN